MVYAEQYFRTCAASSHRNWEKKCLQTFKSKQTAHVKNSRAKRNLWKPTIISFRVTNKEEILYSVPGSVCENLLIFSNLNMMNVLSEITATFGNSYPSCAGWWYPCSIGRRKKTGDFHWSGGPKSASQSYFITYYLFNYVLDLLDVIELNTGIMLILIVKSHCLCIFFGSPKACQFSLCWILTNKETVK